MSLPRVHTAILIVSILGLAGNSSALSTALTYDVLFDGLPVGVLSFRNRVVEAGPYRCQYTGRFSRVSEGLGRTRICRLDEYRAGDHFDCEENRKGFFTTLVVNAESGCWGFDEFGQATRISTLVAGESPAGHLYGVVMSQSIGDVEGLEIVPRAPLPQPESEIPIR
jgi:hypothetical protein